MTPNAMADQLAKTIKGLLNFTVMSRQDSENVGAVVQEIAAALAQEYQCGVKEGCGCTPEVPCVIHFPMLAQARAEAYEEGKRDSIIEFCEGDRSMLAEYEQKAYAKGRAEARLEIAKDLEMHADYLDGTKRFMIDPDYLRERAKAIRLATPPELKEK